MFCRLRVLRNSPLFCAVSNARAFTENPGPTLSVLELPLIAQDDTIVNHVVDELRKNGISITAIHNHVLASNPQMVFLHGDSTATPYTVARAVRQAMNVSTQTWATDDSTQDSDAAA